jgi:hypothetical protein
MASTSIARMAAALLGIVVTSGGQVNVLTGQYDNDRSNSNMAEPWLTAQNVNSTYFGKLFSRNVDGAIYGQPLYASNVSMPGVGVRNIVYVCTMHNSVYAFDAENPSVAAYWHVNLGSSVPNAGTGTLNIYDEIGILSAPVIDPATQTLYVAAHTIVNGSMTVQLHALDMATSAEKYSGPISVQASVLGTGGDSLNGVVPLTYSTAQGITQIQRPSLALVNYNSSKTVYLAFGGYTNDLYPYHGWLIAYDAANLQIQTAVFNTSPNGEAAAIWHSGTGPAVDSTGNIYAVTGNGDYDGISSFGDSVLKLSTAGNALLLLDWFAPDNDSGLSFFDQDLGTSGAHLLPGSLVVAGGKTGKLFLMNTAALGHLQPGNTQIVQSLQATPACADQYCSGQVSPRITGFALWNRPTLPLLYIWGGNDVLRIYPLRNGLIDTTPSSVGSVASTFFGGTMALSANGVASGSGILWATTSVESPNVNPVPATLRAYNAENAAQELWNSELNPAQDRLGTLAKYVPPLVANGKVYAATLSNTLSVYGLQCGSDLTGLVSVVRSGFRYQASSGHFLQTVTITNTSPNSIPGPISILVQNLSSNASLANSTGATTCGAGGPYINLPMNTPYLAAGGSPTVTLDFSNPSKAGITYAPATSRGGLFR